MRSRGRKGQNVLEATPKPPPHRRNTPSSPALLRRESRVATFSIGAKHPVLALPIKRRAGLRSFGTTTCPPSPVPRGSASHQTPGFTDVQCGTPLGGASAGFCPGCDAIYASGSLSLLAGRRRGLAESYRITWMDVRRGPWEQTLSARRDETDRRLPPNLGGDPRPP